jgi:hypothetical protein
MLCEDQTTQPEYHYTAFGLDICTCLPLPELLTGRAGRPADVRISYASLPRPPANELDDGRYAAYNGREAQLYWEWIGMFVVQDGCRILIDPLPDLPDGVLRQFLLGSVFSVLLHQRGHLVLHASAVAIDNAAAVFVGHKGFGKSTTAAALHARGHTLLTDDVVAMDLGNPAGPMVLPSFPQFKLWPETASFLGVDPQQLPQLVDVPEVVKRARPIDAGFATTALPLRAIFMLDVDDTVQIEAVSAQHAFLALMPHWQSARQGEKFAKVVGSPEFFQKGAALVANVPVYRLGRPFDFDQMPQVINAIETQLTQSAVPT